MLNLFSFFFLQEPVTDIYVAGQDYATTSIKDFSATLVKRDFLKFYQWDGLIDGDVGVIVVPETPIPKEARVVEPENAQEVLEQWRVNNPDDKKLEVS